MLRRIAGTMTVAAALLAFPSLASADTTPVEPVECTGTIANKVIAGDVFVPLEANCTLDTVVVRGSIETERRSASLKIVDGSVVRGNVTCAECGTFVLDRSIVAGNLSVTELFEGSRTCASVVRGTTEIGAVVGVTVGDGTSACRGNAFLSDATLLINSGTTVDGNAFNGNLSITSSRDVAVRRNIIRGDLGCEFNAPTPTLSQNIVLGERTGQCATAPAV